MMPSTEADQDSPSFSFGHFLEESRLPVQPLKYNHFQLSYEQNNILPWNVNNQKQHIMEESKWISSMRAKQAAKVNNNFGRELVSRKRSPSEKQEELKINNNFLEFRINRTGKGSRNTKMQSLEAHLNQTLEFDPATKKIKAASLTKCYPLRDPVLSKTPKIQFLQRKFRHIYNGSASSKKKTLQQSDQDPSKKRTANIFYTLEQKQAPSFHISTSQQQNNINKSSYSYGRILKVYKASPNPHSSLL